MSRPLTVVAFVLITLLPLAGASVQPGASAQEATPTTTATHPFIGAWIVDTDVAIDVNFPALAVATADGTYIESHPEVGVGVGTWEATGERTANLTIVFRAPGETGAPVGLITAHATLEVTADGAGWEAPYSFEGVTPDGTVLFAGEGQSRAVRVGAEAVATMATPTVITPTP